MKLLIDWSVLCHINWHKMSSPDYEARTDIEQAEFARNIAGSIMYYKERFKPDEMLFALDGSSYWRYRIFDKYYVKNTVVLYEKAAVEDTETKEVFQKDVYYLQYDMKTFKLEWHDGMEKYIRTKLKKAEIADLLAAKEAGKVHVVSREKTPYKVLEMFPRYKGDRRAAKWDYTTTRDEFKAMCQNAAKNLAHTFGARVIRIDTAEADDVAYVYHQLHPKEDMIFISTDSDWHQLMREGSFLKFYNPMKMEWVETTQDQAGIDLAIKIVSGDSSDGIAGLCPNDGKALVGPKGAEKLVVEHGVPGIYKYLKENFPEEPLNRNLRLIYLKNTPRKVKDEIIETLGTKTKKITKKHTPKEYGLEKADILSIQGAAEEARESDIEDGMYEE